MQKEENQRKPLAAFVLSLLAGLWMLVSSAAGGMGWHGWMLGRGDKHMWMWRHNYMNDVMTTGAWSWIGLALAILVCVAATIIYVRPQGRIGWGVTIIAGSVFAAATNVGFLPAVLGVIGGILAVTWRPNA